MAIDHWATGRDQVEMGVGGWQRHAEQLQVRNGHAPSITERLAETERRWEREDGRGTQSSCRYATVTHHRSLSDWQRPSGDGGGGMAEARRAAAGTQRSRVIDSRVSTSHWPTHGRRGTCRHLWPRPVTPTVCKTPFDHVLNFTSCQMSYTNSVSPNISCGNRRPKGTTC